MGVEGEGEPCQVQAGRRADMDQGADESAEEQPHPLDTWPGKGFDGLCNR